MTPDIPTVALSDPTFSLIFDAKSSVQKGMLEDLAGGDRYEPGTWEAFKRILRPGDHMVDVGAHVGVFACLAAALVGETGWVTAFEPDKVNFSGLVQNKALNGFDHLDVKPWAVSDKQGRIIFHLCADNDGGHAIYDPGLQRGNELSRAKPRKRAVECVMLDSLCDEMAPRLVKIDVEGAEATVLRGAQQLIAAHRPAIIAEQNTIGQLIMGETETDMRHLVTRHGYRTYAMQDSAPWFVPLRADQTVRPTMTLPDGREGILVFNFLFVPDEWPEF